MSSAFKRPGEPSAIALLATTAATQQRMQLLDTPDSTTTSKLDFSELSCIVSCSINGGGSDCQIFLDVRLPYELQTQSNATPGETNAFIS